MTTTFCKTLKMEEFTFSKFPELIFTAATYRHDTTRYFTLSTNTTTIKNSIRSRSSDVDMADQDSTQQNSSSSANSSPGSVAAGVEEEEEEEFHTDDEVAPDDPSDVEDEDEDVGEDLEDAGSVASQLTLESIAKWSVPKLVEEIDKYLKQGEAETAIDLLNLGLQKFENNNNFKIFRACFSRKYCAYYTPTYDGEEEYMVSFQLLCIFE